MVKMLMPSLLGLALCIICLMGTTWSWFTDNVTASVQNIKAADYSIIVDIKDGEELEYGKYSLSQMTEGKGYPVTVKASGTASTGYFSISGPEGFLPLYSTQLAPGEVITFTFYPNTTGEYYFESAWGTYSGENTIRNTDIIGTPKPSEEKMDATEGLEDTNLLGDSVDSTPVPKPNEEENIDIDITEGSDEEINKDLDGDIDEIPSTAQLTEVPDDIEGSVEKPAIETTEGTLGNAGQNQE